MHNHHVKGLKGAKGDRGSMKAVEMVRTKEFLTPVESGTVTIHKWCDLEKRVVSVEAGQLPEPATSRHDIIPWTYLNLTHVRPLSSVDAEDIQNILNKTILVAHRNNPQLKYFGLHSVYRNFDAVRGMNYRMHLSFYDRGRLEHVFNSIEVVKPMVKRIEIAPLGLRYAQQRRRGRRFLPYLPLADDPLNNLQLAFGKTAGQQVEAAFGQEIRLSRYYNDILAFHNLANKKNALYSEADMRLGERSG
ncbi:chondroitin synthase [Culex quinquefasciatus]|uniref:Hexosyltransferase n=1 Tax=Culex quinquefasciatus TaxID=7176 RepID=B0W6B9_CULQU|nr:chondroitin synthase [Culex quinquefasciatus]|eukprot:XP_001844253.1 chondroitin synthase [Culex quinquefasciatus]